MNSLLKTCLGIIGLGKKDEYITDLSFDILSLEALFLVPRHVCTRASLVSKT